jgi:tetratricopeptide (TPR) repeat protein
MTQFSSAEDAIAEADRLSTEAVCQEDEATKSQLLAKARTALGSVLVDEPNNPRIHHWLGLCWYGDPARSDEIRRAIEFHFKEAVRLAPDYQFPSLYLGHFYFDEGRYVEAWPLFERADEEYFREIGQVWRVLKNRELILCCRLYINPGEVAVSDLEAVCSAYTRADREDVCVPEEIVTCVATLAEVVPGESRAMASRVVELVSKLGYENAFLVRRDYQRLRQSIQAQTGGQDRPESPHSSPGDSRT